MNDFYNMLILINIFMKTWGGFANSGIFCFVSNWNIKKLLLFFLGFELCLFFTCELKDC